MHWQLILHVLNYTIITYRYCKIPRWDKNHSTQYEMAILILYRFFKNVKANYRKRVVYWLKTFKYFLFLTASGLMLISDEYITIQE